VQTAYWDPVEWSCFEQFENGAAASLKRVAGIFIMLTFQCDQFDTLSKWICLLDTAQRIPPTEFPLNKARGLSTAFSYLGFSPG